MGPILKLIRLFYILLGSLFLLGCSQITSLTDGGADVYTPLDQTKIQAQTLDQIWNELQENELTSNLRQDDWEQIYENYGALSAESMSPQAFHSLMQEMIAELSGGSVRLISREDRIQNALTSGPNLRGIGAFTGIRDGIDEEPRLIVLHVMPDSAAARAGIAPHEVILSINGETIEMGQGRAAQQALRIGEDEELQLLVRAVDGTPRRVTIRQTADPPRASRIESRILPFSDVLYIQFPPIEGRNSREELLEIVSQYRSRSAKSGIIIDTRIMTVQRQSTILNMLPVITDGLVLNRVENGQISGISIDGISSGMQAGDGVPIVIIQGRDTVGFGELFAAALQSTGRATIIGQSTEGRVDDIEIVYLPNGSQLFMPTTAYIVPDNGRNIGLQGVEPDFVIDSDWDTFTSNNDPLLDQAMNLLNENK